MVNGFFMVKMRWECIPRLIAHTHTIVFVESSQITNWSNGQSAFSLWVVSPWQPRLSLMAAAVTVTCIIHLSKHLSSTHPLSAENQHHSITTHVLTCSQTPSQDLHKEEHTRTRGALVYRRVPIMVTNSAWAGSHLWVMVWRVVRVKLPRHLPFPDGSAGCPRALSGGQDC